MWYGSFPVLPTAHEKQHSIWDSKPLTEYNVTGYVLNWTGHPKWIDGSEMPQRTVSLYNNVDDEGKGKFGLFKDLPQLKQYLESGKPFYIGHPERSQPVKIHKIHSAIRIDLTERYAMNAHVQITPTPTQTTTTDNRPSLQHLVQNSILAGV